MQNANIGLVDITLTCHFEVKDAEVFGGAEIPEGRQVCPTCLKEASR